MTELWVDEAPGERRAALYENGEIVEIHIQRDLQPILGQQGTGRIDRKTPSGAYVLNEAGHELLVRGRVENPEGARLSFEIAREVIAEPGRLKVAEAKPIAEHTHFLDCDNLWERRLSVIGPTARPKAKRIEDIFGCAQLGTSILGDVSVHFQRTKAGLVFDVDGNGDAFLINSIAAKEIARLLRLFQIGGMAMIDFVAMDSKAARHELAEIFDATSSFDGRPFERTGVNGFGMMQVVRSRPRPSVLDHLFGTYIGALSEETKALWLYRDVANSKGFGSRIVSTSGKVAALMESPGWQLLRVQCERLAGAATVIIADEKTTGYGHVHVAQS